MAKKKRKVKKQSRQKAKNSSNKMTLAVISLILNVIIFPGLGSLVGGKTYDGVWQLIIAVIGVILSFFTIGIPILIAAWIWGIYTGIKMIKEAQ